MSGKSARQIRKSLNAFRRDRADIARSLIEELENAPFRYRFRFAWKLVFHRKKK